jgi:predicted ATPase
MVMSTNRVIITGGPGAGKTTLLAELATLGYATVEESARAIIAGRVAAGETPRPEPAVFAREILRRDVDKYLHQPPGWAWVFFDRGVVEALGMLQEVAPLPPDQLASMLCAYPFHRTVFILPPWEDIYTQDAERDQTFDEAVSVHARLVQWYGACGYVLHEVPRLPVSQRARHVLHALATRCPDVVQSEGLV